MKKLLLTGAAGRIGSRLIEDLVDKYDLTAADKDCSAITEWEDKGCRLVTFEVTDLSDCRQLCEGMDTVIHLAGNPSPFAKYDELKGVNIDGTYNMMQAASEQGVSRLIFASSIHAVKGYAADEQVKTTSPVRPPDLYGASKAFGEAIGHYYGTETDMEVVAIRIGGYRSLEVMKENGEEPDMRERSTYVSKRDLNQLIQKCAEATLGKPFMIVHGLSDNTFKFMDLTDTKEKTGYAPVDNGFDFQ